MACPSNALFGQSLPTPLRRFEVVIWCLEWECCTFGTIHQNSLYYMALSIVSRPENKEQCKDIKISSTESPMQILSRRLSNNPFPYLFTFPFSIARFLITDRGHNVPGTKSVREKKACAGMRWDAERRNSQSPTNSHPLLLATFFQSLYTLSVAPISFNNQIF